MTVSNSEHCMGRVWKQRRDLQRSNPWWSHWNRAPAL